jgi:cytochrome c biogenesis protein CcdA
MKLGATWGLGHGCSAMFLGIVAFALKGSIHIFPEKLKFLLKLGHLTEAAVGASLVLIGAVGIKENIDSAREEEEAKKSGEASQIENEDMPVAAVRMKSAKALFANGLLHGFSWDGAPSLAPALAMSSWRSALAFLLSYCIGTMAAMSLTAGAFGEFSMRLGKAANNPDLPRNLSIGSSIVAIVIGVYWIVQALILK